MAAVVQGVEEVRNLIGQPPVVIGGLAVMCRLSTPYRATTDLDLVDRLRGQVPQLQVLRAARDAEPVEPAAVLLPTPYGQVKVDVLEVRQVEIDQPSDDPGDRLHASAHAWANDTASEVTIEVASMRGAHWTTLTLSQSSCSERVSGRRSRPLGGTKLAHAACRHAAFGRS